MSLMVACVVMVIVIMVAVTVLEIKTSTYNSRDYPYYGFIAITLLGIGCVFYKVHYNEQVTKRKQFELEMKKIEILHKGK